MKWINPKDRLPEFDQNVLTKTIDNARAFLCYTSQEDFEEGELWLDESELVEDKWISVLDELPKCSDRKPESETVLVTNGTISFISNYWAVLGAWSDDDDDITHWQPLPSLPIK